MATAAEIQAIIDANLAKPKRVRTSTAEFEQHSIPDQLAAQKQAAAGEAGSNNEYFGFRVRKARFGQTCEE